MLLLLIPALFLGTPGETPADFNGAVQAYNEGRREEAIAELTALAGAGDAHAKYTLGIIYVEGKGIPVDHEKALKWFTEAANEGNAFAQYSLGVMHASGMGIPKDPVKGLMWLNIARQDNKNQPYERLRIVSTAALVKKSMTPEQIAEAIRLAKAWKPGQK